MHADFSNKAAPTKKDTTLGGFSGWYTGPVWVNAQISYSLLNYDIKREVQLGPATRIHRGSPNGSNLTVALKCQLRDVGEGRLRLWLSGWTDLAKKTKLESYTEQNASSTALGYPRSATQLTAWARRLADATGRKRRHHCTYR